MNTKHVFKTLITIVVISLGSTQSAFSAESSISEADWIHTGDSPLLDRELIMGKIYTDMTRQQNCSWKPVASIRTEGPFSRQAKTLIADGQGLDNEINRDTQTALNQTRQMIVAELTENVEALYQDATRTMAYHDVVLVKIADAN